MNAYLICTSKPVKIKLGRLCDFHLHVVRIEIRVKDFQGPLIDRFIRMFLQLLEVVQNACTFHEIRVIARGCAIAFENIFDRFEHASTILAS